MPRGCIGDIVAGSVYRHRRWPHHQDAYILTGDVKRLSVLMAFVLSVVITSDEASDEAGQYGQI